MEGAVVTKSTEVILNYGVLGVFLLVSLFVCWRLWQALQHSQEQRLTETRELVRVIEANSNAMETLTEVVRASTNGRGGRR